MNLFSRLALATAIALVSLTIGSPAAIAQEAVDQNEVAKARALLKAGREEMIKGEMQLSKAEEEAFWPIYVSYRDEVDKVNDRQAKIISTYMGAYWNAELDDDLAKLMLDEHFAIKSATLKLEQKYRRQFLKVLPVGKVTRLYQLENKLEAEIDIALAQLVPLYETD